MGNEVSKPSASVGKKRKKEKVKGDSWLLYGLCVNSMSLFESHDSRSIESVSEEEESIVGIEKDSYYSLEKTKTTSEISSFAKRCYFIKNGIGKLN